MPAVPGSPVEPGPELLGGCVEAAAAIFVRVFILACRRTLLLRNRGSWLLLRQLSTAL